MSCIRRLLLSIAFIALSTLTACAGLPSQPSIEERQSLAPTGRLRVGIHVASPSREVITQAGSALAKRLGVEFELIRYASQSELLAAISDGQVDFSGTNASPARVARMDFTTTVLDIELGYMAVSGSPVASIADVDRAGIRIGVTQGSTSLTILPNLLKNATVISTTPSKSARQMFLAKEIDTFATNKAILHDMLSGIPNATILEGNWGYEHWAFCIPKGRQTGLAYLENFTQFARSSGLIKKVIEKENIKWTTIP